MDGRAATVAQFQMAGDEVGVEVGEEDVADLKAKFLGVGQVLLDVALGVDDDGGRTGLVSEQIGGVGQAAQVVLFQNHRSLSAFRAGRCKPPLNVTTGDDASRARKQVCSSNRSTAVPFENLPAEQSARQGQKCFMDVSPLFIAYTQTTKLFEPSEASSTTHSNLGTPLLHSFKITAHVTHARSLQLATKRGRMMFSSFGIQSPKMVCTCISHKPGSETCRRHPRSLRLWESAHLRICPDPQSAGLRLIPSCRDELAIRSHQSGLRV